jgi:hypothetical protein
MQRSDRATTRGFDVIGDGLAGWRAVADVGCLEQPAIIIGRHREDLPDLRWSNSVISTLKTRFCATVLGPKLGPA